jgi:hypothetical protein
MEPSITTQAEPAAEPAEPAKRREFLASLLDAYTKARPLRFFQQWRPQDLIDSGIPTAWLRENHLLGGPDELPAWCSQRRFAEIATRTFGRTVNQIAVSRAVRLEGLAAHVTASNGRIRTAAALEWWRANKASSETEITSEAEHRRERQRIARQREEIELAEIERKFSAKWIAREQAMFTFCRATREIHLEWKRTIERYFPESVETYAKNTLNLPAETVAALKSFLRDAGRKIVDEIELEGARKSRACAAKLDASKTENL